MAKSIAYLQNMKNLISDAKRLSAKGIKLADIAEHLGVSVGMAHYYLHRVSIEKIDRQIKMRATQASEAVRLLKDGRGVIHTSIQVGICKSGLADLIAEEGYTLAELIGRKKYVRASTKNQPKGNRTPKKTRTSRARKIVPWVTCKCKRAKKLETDVDCYLCHREQAFRQVGRKAPEYIPNLTPIETKHPAIL